MSEDLNPTQAENRGDVQAPVTPSPEVEQQAPQPSDGPAQEPASSQAQSQGDEKKPSRAEQRIREQHSQIRALQDQLSQLQPQQPLPPWQQPQTNEYGEVTADQVLGASQLQAQQEAEKARKEFQFQLDLRDVYQGHPELDPKSDHYDEELDQAVADLYQQSGGIYGQTPLAKTVERVMKVAARQRTEAEAQTARTLAQQRAESGLTPSNEAGKSSPEARLQSLRDEAKRTGNWRGYFAEEARLRE